MMINHQLNKRKFNVILIMSISCINTINTIQLIQ